jgi:hypothetical protein
MSIKTKVVHNDKDCSHKWFTNDEAWEEVTLTGDELAKYRESLILNKLHLYHLPAFNRLHFTHKKEVIDAFQEKKHFFNLRRVEAKEHNRKVMEKLEQIRSANIFSGLFWKHLFNPMKPDWMSEEFPSYETRLDVKLDIMTKDEASQRFFPVWFRTSDLDAHRTTKSQKVNKRLYDAVMAGNVIEILFLLNLNEKIQQK